MKKLLPFLALFLVVELPAQWDTLVTNSTANFHAIAFTSRDTGVAVGGDRTTGAADIRRTTDGGQAWSQPSFPQGPGTLNGVRFFDAMNGCIVGDSGCVMLTTNGGASWDTVTRFTDRDLYCVSYPTLSAIFIGGAHGALYRSLDAGNTWDTLDGGTTLAIRDMAFINAAAGWIVGDGGYLAATGDGGDTFTVFAQPYFGFFQPRGFAYAGTTNNAYAVGEYGWAITSADGGLNWDTLFVPGEKNLNQVRFGNDWTGIICGDSGFVYHTRDGGASWNVETTGILQNLNDIAFAGDTTAYICGDSGRVLKSRTDISGIHHLPASAFTISAFPNPFHEQLNIVLDLEQASDVTIFITDLSGRVVVRENKGEISAGKNILQPDFGDLAPGLYIIRIEAGGSLASLPVIRR